MATRGRPKPAAKKAVKKPVVVKKPTAKEKVTKKTSLVSTALEKVSSLSGLSSAKSKARGVGVKKSAKHLLKKAYERRAKREIRMGNLGKARRTLRKKQTVI